MNEIKIYMDGDKWCALLGSDIQEGVCGFGATPRDALEQMLRNEDFDQWNWVHE